MSLISLMLTLVVVGIVLFLINSYVPMEARIKQLLNIVVVLIVAVWLIQALLPGMADIRIGP